MTEQSSGDKKKEVRCSACKTKLFVSEEVSNKPVEIYEHCERCRRWNKTFDVLAFCFLGFAIFLIVAGIFFFKDFSVNFHNWLSAFGLAFDISGVVFLLGNLEKVLISAGVWDAHTVISKELPRHVRKTRAGLILIIIGFILQLLGSLLKT